MAVFHSGFIAILGRPNVGKSTILNRYVGEKVAIVSPRPQTTRNRILGVMTREDVQIVFVDTPGIHAPRTRLGEYMVKTAGEALVGADAVLFVVDATDVREADMRVLDTPVPKGAKRFLAINKTDIADTRAVAECIRGAADRPFEDIVPVSARTGEGMDTLLNCLIKAMPEGPKYFPDDQYTDHPESFLIAELIREKALLLLNEEVPHGVGVEILAIKEGPRLTEIHANVLCEKPSHKGILIGKGGRMLRRIGETARADIETLLGRQVNLQLWIKVREGWRDREGDLRLLGYQ